MSILNDATIEEMNEGTAENLAADLDQTTVQNNVQGATLPHIDFSFLKAPTGEGAIEDYLDHVLNNDHSMGIAQMLRGFTGLAGNLNLAILDITFGAFKFLKENKEKKAAPTPTKKDDVKLYEQPIINV